jgi:hypothetical protein
LAVLAIHSANGFAFDLPAIAFRLSRKFSDFCHTTEGIAMLRARWKLIYLLHAGVYGAVGCLFAADTCGQETTAAARKSNWVVIPSGVADADSQTAYVTGSNESLSAHDLNSGEARWETKEAQLALAVAGDRVIARTSQNNLPPNAMQIVVLDAATGKVQMRCRQVIFPEWAAVGGGLGLSFDVVASDNGNYLLLTWRAGR